MALAEGMSSLPALHQITFDRGPDEPTGRGSSCLAFVSVVIGVCIALCKQMHTKYCITPSSYGPDHSKTTQCVVHLLPRLPQWKTSELLECMGSVSLSSTSCPAFNFFLASFKHAWAPVDLFV